jgi:hypothetical protein
LKDLASLDRDRFDQAFPKKPNHRLETLIEAGRHADKPGAEER